MFRKNQPIQLQYNEAGGRKNMYTVSELNANIKSLLEENFPFVWIFGEISNFRIPASGHFYFTLKDDVSQISSVSIEDTAGRSWAGLIVKSPSAAYPIHIQARLQSCVALVIKVEGE